MAAIVTAAAIASGAPCGCNGRGHGGDRDDGGALVVRPENLTRVTRTTIGVGPRVVGTIRARDRASIRAEVAGTVEQVKVDIGERVERGQILARLDEVGIREAYASSRRAVEAASQELAVAERHARRVRNLVRDGAMPAREQELAVSQEASARARLALARAGQANASRQLESATVRSPMDGSVSERAVNAGDVVAVGAPLFTIIDRSTMRLEASVPTDDLRAVRPRATVAFEVRGYPGRSFEGVIERVAPAADPATRQIGILVSIPNQSSELVAGLFAEGRVASTTREVVAAPLGAVDGAPGGEHGTVMRVRGGVVQRIQVKLGLRDAARELVELIGDVQPGDELLVSGTEDIRSGARVELSRDDGGGRD